jgi:hypothetical protein
MRIVVNDEKFSIFKDAVFVNFKCLAGICLQKLEKRTKHLRISGSTVVFFQIQITSSFPHQRTRSNLYMNFRLDKKHRIACGGFNNNIRFLTTVSALTYAHLPFWYRIGL